MELDIIAYQTLATTAARKKLETALFTKGIVGISGVPDFIATTTAYINAARAFSALPAAIKAQYAPARAAGETEGYELGAEQFQDESGAWQVDDKKASFYAFVPEDARNHWPREVDLKTPYLSLGELIFITGKMVLDAIGLNTIAGLNHEGLVGYGRMLHYHKESDATNVNPNWCGAHFDHGVFTGLVPAYYFRSGEAVAEPEEAGLFIKPTDREGFEKIYADDKSILLFQVGEFGQLASHDRIQATKHFVKKARGGIERYTFALFYSAAGNTVVQSRSVLREDARYVGNRMGDGSIAYSAWENASFARYLAK